jgi:hypothetical protein
MDLADSASRDEADTEVFASERHVYRLLRILASRQRACQSHLPLSYYYLKASPDKVRLPYGLIQ